MATLKQTCSSTAVLTALLVASVGCVGPQAPLADAGTGDAGLTDAGTSDAGLTDAGATDGGQTAAVPMRGGCQMFPEDNILNARIDRAPVSAKSSTYLARFRTVAGPHPGAGAGALVWQGSRGGIPVNIGGVTRTLSTDGSYGLVAAAFTTVMPQTPRVEGEPNPQGAWDQHVLTIDPADCTLTEVISYRYDFLRGWLVGGGAKWNLRTNARLTPVVAGAGVAEAAGLPMAPLLYRYEEVVDAGAINHPIRFASNAFSPQSPAWPAVSSDGRDPNPDAMPMGSRLRLRGDVDLSGLGPQARVVARAMQTFGIIAGDSTTTGWGLGGEGDERWDDADLGTLATLDVNQFEVVDVSGWMVSPDSLQALPH